MLEDRISWLGLFIGLSAGLLIGLVYTWFVNPVIEYDTAPWQLAEPKREQYIALIALAYQHDQNLARAEERLAVFSFEDIGLAVARLACDFFRRAEDVTLTLALVELAHAYGQPTCADMAMRVTPAPTGPVTIVVPTDTPSPSLTPTETPAFTPSPASSPAQATPTVRPSPSPSGAFEVVNITAFCNPLYSGVIQVYVQEADGEGIPGIAVRAFWNDGGERFFTGLQPGDRPGFANFTMQAEKTYQVELPGRSIPSRLLEPDPCVPYGGLEDGEVTLTGYTVTFQRAASD